MQMKTAQPDLNDIVKEIRVLGSKIEKLEKIVERRLVGEVNPDKYEKKAIAEFENKKRTKMLNFQLIQS